jgi:hypothetical protein
MAKPLDPAHIDVIAQPRRRRAHVPKNMRPMLEEAEKRVTKRPAVPAILLKQEAGDDDSCSYHSPWVEQRDWELMLADAFGTRSMATIYLFVEQLIGLCRKQWDPSANRWMRGEGELNQCLNLINGQKPQNEMEASICVQMCAIHLMQMRITGRALSAGWPDPKDAYAASALGRTYAHLYDSLNRGRGKTKTTKQKIEVRYERHNHDHQHVHFEGGGGDSSYQPHASPGPDGGNACVAALPSQSADGDALPLRSGPRPARLPDARRQGIGCSEG